MPVQAGTKGGGALQPRMQPCRVAPMAYFADNRNCACYVISDMPTYVISDMPTAPEPKSENMSVSAGKHWEKFIETAVRQGCYGSASEVVREGLRLVESARRSSKRSARRSMRAIEGGGDNSADDIDAMIDSLAAASKAKAR
jgi:antitoxin ParD1/3/4